MHADGAGEFLNDLVGTVEFAHVVTVNNIDGAVFTASDELVGEWAGDSRNDDASAGAEIQVIVVEEEVRRKVIQHLKSGAARREFQIGVAPISDAGVEGAVAGDGEIGRASCRERV